MTDFEVWIDYREKELPNLFKYSPHTKFKHLKIADIQFVHTPTQKPIIILERKTAKDLASSINDGRYVTQKAEMKKWIAENASSLDNVNINIGFPAPCIGYLIEGFWWKDPTKVLHYAQKNNRKYEVTTDTLLSVITKMLFRDGFFILTSQSMSETQTLINKIHHNLSSNAFQPKDDHTYHEQLLKAKLHTNVRRKHYNQINTINSKYNEWWLMALANIQGMSLKKAKAVSNIYSDPKTLLRAFDKCKTKTLKQNLLRNTIQRIFQTIRYFWKKIEKISMING